MHGGTYLRGAYTWSNTNAKGKVGLFVGGLYMEGFIGGEIQYVLRTL